MANLFNTPRFTALDSNGDPISGSKLNFYEAGTTTRLDTFSDEGLTVANANPVVADSAGRFGQIWLKSQDYKVVFTDAADVTIWTQDPIHGNPAVSGDEFAASPQSVPDMTVQLTAGNIFNTVSKLFTVVAAQNSATITAPSSNPRRDIIFIDRLTGVVGIQTGAENASPVDPTIADGKLPVVRITLATTTTTITDSEITDIRELGLLGFGLGGDTLPKLGAPLDTNAQAINESEGTAVASAATTDIWVTDGNTVHITGTTTITSLGTAPRVGAWRKVIFDGILTLTDGANLNLPGAANITTAADDFAFVYAETTTLFKVLYFSEDGSAISGNVTTFNFTDTSDVTINTLVPTGTLWSSSQSIIIPTKGLIIFDPYARCDNAAGANRSWSFGLRINAVDHFPYIDVDGTKNFQETGTLATGSFQVHAGVINLAKGDLLQRDIEGHGISTGAQTVQPIIASDNASGSQTLKGVTVTSRLAVTIIDRS